MKHLGIFILGALLLASCATNKRAAYIQQVQTDIPTAIEQDYQIRIKPLDRLTVTINSKDPELAAPFNAASSYNSLNGLSTYSSSSNGNLQILTVDKEGKIQLPIIGEIDCDGLTRNELAKKIENTIRENGMVHDPIVIIQFADVKFSVLGEVARPGQFSITKDRISLFDALAMAGDLTIYGQRENVALIREENGMRTVHYFDLKNPDILASPYFYLQQDDVVYVTPNKYKAQAGDHRLAPIAYLDARNPAEQHPPRGEPRPHAHRFGDPPEHRTARQYPTAAHQGGVVPLPVEQTRGE